MREFGRQLGIHDDLVMRHPFPGPGIAIRIIGEVTPERVSIARKADHIFISMIKEAGIYNEVCVPAMVYKVLAYPRMQMSQAYAGVDTSRGTFL